MKKLIYKIIVPVFALFIFNFSLLILNCSAQWVQMSNGMTNQTVYCLAAGSNYIYAGTFYGVKASTDNGANWTQTSMYNYEVDGLIVNGNNVFAGTYALIFDDGVFLSTNNGLTWVQTSLNNWSVPSFAISGNYVFAGTYNSGVKYTTNNGTTWYQTNLFTQTVFALAVSGNYLYAGTRSNLGVYLTTNNGTTWTQTSLNNRTVYSLAVSGNNIFAGTASYGVYKSTDNGTTWTQTSLNNRSVSSLAVSGNNIFAATASYGVYVSTDNGENWTQRNEGFGSATSMDALCVFNNYIFAGTASYSVYRRPLDEIITGIKPISEQLPSHYSLKQNYPNPFNPSTNIRYDLPKNGFVKLVVFDALGREVETLVNENQQVGVYEATFNASQYSSGVYYYKLTSGDFLETKKMMLVK